MKRKKDIPRPLQHTIDNDHLTNPTTLAFVTRKVFILHMVATLCAIPPGLVLTGRIYLIPLPRLIAEASVPYVPWIIGRQDALSKRRPSLQVNLQATKVAESALGDGQSLGLSKSVR